MPKKKRILSKIQLIHKVPRPLLLSLFVLGIIVSIFALRANNVHMVQLRDQLYAADKSGGDVNKALNSLRLYVYGHMNTNLSSGGNSIKPPIQLKYTYQRLQAAEAGRVSAINNQLYTDAENYCQATVPNGFYGAYRIPCVQDYLSKHSTVTPNPVPAGLYKFDFVSPGWSPDFAGWSLVVSALLLLAYIFSLASHHLLGGEARLKDL